MAASPKHGTARRLSTPPPPKNQPFVEWGGDRGCLPWRRPSTTLHIAYPPLPHPPPPCPGKINVAQARHCTSPIPPEEQALHGMGGGNREGSPWRCPRTALQVAYPPLEKPTIRVMGGGGRGSSPGRCSTARRLSPPSPPLVLSGIIKN